MAQMLFSQIYMHLAKTSERWENLYTASSTRRMHSANVVMAQWKRPCHTKPRFHCVGTELFKFPECREIASKSWFFSRKRAYHGVLTASLQRPWHCYRARMAFYRSYGVLVGALTTLSLRFRGARNACTASTLRRRRAEDAVQGFSHLSVVLARGLLNLRK